MKSIGNDIIALKYIDLLRTPDLSFISKIISAEELMLYKQQDFSLIPFKDFHWLAWSVKESVYKYM